MTGDMSFTELADAEQDARQSASEVKHESTSAIEYKQMQIKKKMEQVANLDVELSAADTEKLAMLERWSGRH